MNWDVVSACADAIGVAGVIISLLYVARQLRLTAQSSRAAAQQTLIDKTVTHGKWICEDPARIGIFRRALADFDGLSPDERHIAFTTLDTYLTGLENALYFREAGICPEAVYEMQEKIALLILNTPGGRQFWDTARHLINDDGRRRINQLLAGGGEGVPPLNVLMPWLSPEAKAA